MHTPPTHTPHFPFQSALTLAATGRWGRGGYALVGDGDREQQVRLPRALFDVVALLLQEARRGAARPDAHGFLTPEELLHRFERIPRQRAHAGLLDREHVIKYIYRLRKLLDDALPPLPGQPESAPASGLLEFREFLGYRLSAPAERLHLKIIEDAPATPV